MSQTTEATAGMELQATFPPVGGSRLIVFPEGSDGRVEVWTRKEPA